ncbi:hypothetical protein Sru01_44410 [Sphaerisporangium rufum]|uniref:Uncharacterized protein n=1 Tax=Sphaerisporangium rufum TaxID=1381558 RepID=A0A919R4L5_9ACTN|nr:hypothetical protein [Sphaerisporangium rufum]GII79459.1 hypothetical protein Sru01_44410 [Sphaerisporangium rufum]
MTAHGDGGKGLRGYLAGFFGADDDPHLADDTHAFTDDDGDDDAEDLDDE